MKTTSQKGGSLEMQSKKHCNFLVHYQLLWQKCNLFVDNWLPYKLARYVYSSNSIAPIPIELTQHPLSVTKPLTHNVDTWWSLNFCRRRRTWTCGKRAPFYRWGSINLILILPHPHFQPQVPSDKVQIRTNSEGVQMVYGTCPILVEGNEYIFRLEMF